MNVPVSVVIPTHNSEATITRALASVLNQSRLPREILVVDDCSSDLTVNIVRQLSIHEGVELRVIPVDTNVGPSVTRKVGWESATSNLTSILDSDDSWHPRIPELQAQWMTEDLCVPICGHLTGIPSDSSIESAPVVREFSFGSFLIRNRVSTPTVMLRRALTERFTSDMWYAEDYDLWLRLTSTFGESELSSHLYPMFRGELHAVHNRITRRCQIAVRLWMSLKYILQVLRTRIRRRP